jgi:hypothetical protein
MSCDRFNRRHHKNAIPQSRRNFFRKVTSSHEVAPSVQNILTFEYAAGCDLTPKYPQKGSNDCSINVHDQHCACRLPVYAEKRIIRIIISVFYWLDIKFTFSSRMETKYT